MWIKKRILITTTILLMSGLFLANKSDFFEVAKQIEIYNTLFKELNMYYIDELNPAEMNNNAIDNMLKNLDPYTKLYDEQRVEDALISRNGEYAGIGAGTRYKDGRVYLTEIYEGAPADQAGLKGGDEVIQIDDVVVKDFEGKSVVDLLKGTPKTTVEIKVLRNGKKESHTVTRDKIVINPVPFYNMIDEKVGYIPLTRFNAKASTEIKKAFEDLKSQGMQELVLDLRHNPGGLLNQANTIVNFFIPKGKVVVSTKAKIKKWSKVYKTKMAPLDAEIPLVILVDERSASASEIVSGALQDYDRAVIIGRRSFGKGLVQRTKKLVYGTQVKLTISKYYTPSGRCIQELDYTNMDKDGNVPKFSDGKQNSFKTTNGRTVYDGGGVTPDITMERPETTKATKALMGSHIVFNYLNDYMVKHPTIAAPESFVYTDADFNAFLQFVENSKEDYDIATDITLDKIQEVAEEDGLEVKLNQKLKELNALISKEKIAELRKNKEEIKQKLTTEIMQRYYYKKGAYQQKLASDPIVEKATQIVSNKSKYDKILK